MELVSLPHFLHNFWRKIFLLLYSINWPNFIIQLPLLCEILRLKLAEVTPVCKKKDPFNKENYHPVSVLLHVSKNFEKIFHEQISSYMEPRFSHLLCGLRKNHNSQHSLLEMLEKWKLVLDKGYNLGTIFLDLSEAFDRLNRELLLAKLNAYGFSENAIAYIKSYVPNRYQRTNINNKSALGKVSIRTYCMIAF